MKKKYLVTTVAMLAAVSMLAACGGKNNENSNDTTPTVTVTPTEAPSSEERGDGPSVQDPTETPEVTVDHNQMIQKVYQAVFEFYGNRYFPNMQVQGEAFFMQDMLKLDASWYDAAIVEMPMTSDSADIFAIVHATEGNVENVKKAFDDYKAYLSDEAQQYVSNIPKVQSAAVEVLNDEYVLFSVLTGLAWVEGVTDESELLTAYGESSRYAVDVAASVISGEYEVELWNDMDLIRNSIAAMYGITYLPDVKIHANAEDLAMRMADELKIDASWVDDIIFEIPMIGAHADKLILVDPSEGNTENVMAALTEHKRWLVEESHQYPQNVARVNSAVVQQVGDYVCFAILGGLMDNWEEQDEETLVQYYEENNMLAIYAIEGYLANQQ